MFTIANQVTIDVEARFIDNVSGNAKAASKAFDDVEKNAREAVKEVDNLGKAKAEPKVDADTSKALDKLNKTEKKLSKLGKSKTDAKLGILDKASMIIEKVAAKVKAFAGKTYSAILKVRDSNVLSTLSNMSSKMKSFAGKTWSAVVKIKDMATAPLRGIKNMLFNIKTLAATIFAGVAAKKLVIDPIGIADSYSSAKIGFSTLLGESAGQKMMDELDAFAKKTPFKTSGVISNAQKMMAMGWDVNNLIGDMEIIGNAAAATGKLDEGLESIVRAMSQIKTKGRLSTEELNQLAEAGIAAKAMLAENLGYGTGDAGIAKMTEDLENGAIASNVAIEALLEGMKKYNGMMDSMANETAEGLKSQIEDTFEINVFRKWGQGLQDGAKRGLGAVVDLLDEADESLSKFGDLMYEIGEKASNWMADKFENAIKRITEITGSFEFKNAGFGEKISMLWKGVVADPLKEWFKDLWTNEDNIQKAADFGQSFAKALTKGILAILGITDIFSETGDGAEGKGANIAQGFARGFVDGFDVSAITSKLVEAIGNVWGALPLWAKVLIGGYAVGKAAGGIASFAGGVGSFLGGIGSIIGTSGTVGAGGSVVGASGLLGLLGKTGVAGVGASGILGGLANTGYALMGGTSALTMGGGTAALIGAGSIAGGLAAGAGLIHAGASGYNAYQGFKAGDKTKGWANVARGGTTLAGIGAGAALGAKAGTAIGALFGGVGAIPGALIGAGLGSVVGWFAGDKIAKNIEAAKYETEGMQEAIKKSDASAEELAQEFEKAKWEKAKECFGDIKLSMDEISRLSKQVVFGDDLGKYEKFATATKTAQSSLEAMNSAGVNTDRWMWKAGLGVTFNDDEKASIIASFDDYINSAKNYVENKHYEFAASAEILLDLESEGGKSILESGNAYYAQVQEQLNIAGEELGNLITSALEDGIISADESDAIAAAQQKIADITKKIADAESDAELTVINLKFGGGKLTQESFDSFLQTTQENLESRLSSADAALEAQITNLNLRFTPDQRNSEEYKKQLQTLLDGYNMEVESVTASVLGVELDILGSTFNADDVLGADAVDDLNNILQECINQGITPAEMSLDDIIKFSGNPELSGESAGLIQDYLSQIFDQLDLSKFEIIEVDGKLQLNLKPEVAEGTGSVVDQVVQSEIPDSIDTVCGIDISGQPEIQNQISVFAEDFGIPESQAAAILLMLSGDKKILNQINVSQLASEFGVPESVAEDVINKLTGEKSIENRLGIVASEFGLPSSVSATIRVRISAVKEIVNKVATSVGELIDGFGYRGGVFGGGYARGGIAGNVPGFSDGGIVRGGSQLIEVAEEGSPEMVIPLSAQRRGRALKLWAQAGNIMGVPGFARGGITYGGQDEGIRFQAEGYGEASGSGQTVQVDVGGITFEIHVDGSDPNSIIEAVKAKAHELADVVAGIINEDLSSQYENTPSKGGAA